jgi:hypothetical protein
VLRANLKWKLVKRLVGSCLVLILTLGTIGCESLSQRLDRQPTTTTPSETENGIATSGLVNTDGPLSEVNIPQSITKLAPSLAKFQPQVRIVSPQPDQILADDRVSVKLQVSDLPLFKSAALGLGNHLHVILDKQTYQGVYDLTQPLIFENLAAGTHTIRVFASRPWHESFKNAGAYAQTTFHILTKTAENNPDPQRPLLTYSRPAGIYGAEPIMLDYYLTNLPESATTASPDRIPDWKVRVTINNQKFIVDRWAPIYLQGFKPGKNWVRLELVDDRGNLIPNVYNDTVSAFSYDPQKKDSLAKLIQGEIDPNLALSLIDPNYVAVNLTPLPVITTPARATDSVAPASSSPPTATPRVVSSLPSPAANTPITIPSPPATSPPQPITLPTPVAPAPQQSQPTAIPNPIAIAPPQPIAIPTPVAIAPQQSQPTASPSPIATAPQQPKILPTPAASVPPLQPAPIASPVAIASPAPKALPNPVAISPTIQPSTSPVPVEIVPQQPIGVPSVPQLSIPIPVLVAPPLPNSLPSPPAIAIDRPQIALAPATIPIIINPNPVATPAPIAPKPPADIPPQPILVPIPVVMPQPTAATTPPTPQVSQTERAEPSSPTIDRPQQVESEPNKWQTKSIELIKFLGVKIRAFTNTIPAKAQRFGHNVQIWTSQAIELVRSWRNKEAG